MSEIKVYDNAGNPLQVGSFVEYINTGTKVMSLKSFQMMKAHGHLSIRNLYYKTDILRIIRKVEEKEIGEKIFSREEINEALQKQKDASKAAEMGDVSLESGG